LKILAVFVLLNAAINFLFTGFHDSSIRNFFAVYVTGNIVVAGVGKAAVFYILVPISYLLLLSAMLLVVCRFYRYTFYVVCPLFFLATLFLNLEGRESANLELVTIGFLGLILGYVPIEKINSFVRHRYSLGVAYFCYTVTITLWEPNYILQIAGVCLTLMLIYLLGTSSAQPAGLRNAIMLLGKYSLFGYIIQIAILQLLRGGLGSINLGTSQLVLSFVAAIALTIIAVVALDRARSKSLAVDRLYKLVFA